MELFRVLIRFIAFRYGKCKWLYIKFCRPLALEYANFLKKWGSFYAIGENCSIPTFANIPDPEYTRLGNNVQLSACTLLGHDGSISMLNRAYNKKLDRVGFVDIKDNVFIGHGAIVMPGVTIESNVIVAAGSVVTKNISEDTIVAGIPAKTIGKVSELVERLEKETTQLPWAHIIAKREGGFDPSLEPELKKLRQQFFFGDKYQ